MWETEELSTDIHIIQRQLDTLRMRRGTSLDSRRSASIGERRGSPEHNTVERNSPAREARSSFLGQVRSLTVCLPPSHAPSPCLPPCLPH